MEWNGEGRSGSVIGLLGLVFGRPQYRVVQAVDMHGHGSGSGWY